MNLEQWKAMQPRIVSIQREALAMSEVGESKVSRLLMTAALAMQRIKPAKVDVVSSAEKPSEKPVKGKGA
ncbi:MAG: hypothetical protein LBV45_06000 [Xanthomonadaceae bacterium]|jgi:hypothetical protein|nr:hypothetical protein [Xanthomonadaceae bacterium]